MRAVTEMEDYAEPGRVRILRYAIIALNLATVIVVSAVFLLYEYQNIHQSRLIAEYHLPTAHLAESATHELAHLEIEIRSNAESWRSSESEHLGPGGPYIAEHTIGDHVYALSEIRRSLADRQRNVDMPRFEAVSRMVDPALTALIERLRGSAAEWSDQDVLEALALLELRLEQLENLNLAAAERLLEEDTPLFEVGERALLLMFVVLAVSASLVTAAIVRRLEVASAERTAAVARMLQASGTLAATTGRLQKAQKIAKMGNWDWTAVTGDLWWSDEFYRLIGLEPQSVPACYETFLDAIHPADRARAKRVVMESAGDGTGYDLNFRIVLPDGNERVLREIAEPVFGEDGDFAGHSGTVQDITESTKVESELARIARGLEKAQQIARVGSWEWDAETDTHNWSDEAFRVLGLEPGSIVPDGKTFLRYVHPDDLERVKAASVQLFVAGTPLNIEYRIIRADGLERTVNVQSEMEKNEAGAPVRIVGTAQDITERKRIERELERLNADLEKHVEERTAELRDAQAELIKSERLATLGQLTATVSHELRNPLGAMRASMYVVEKSIESGGEKAVNAVARINRNISRCDRIIDELLDYTRIRLLELRPTDIDSWLKDVLDEQAVPEGVRVRRKLGVPGLRVPADADRLRRAVINVYDNACQALTKNWQDSPSHGKKQVTIETRVHEGRLEIIFGDNGPGIREDLLDEIFEPLFSTKNFGVGLGLPTVHQIMQQHDGGVTASPRRGGGAKFTLWLPLEREMEAANP